MSDLSFPKGANKSDPIIHPSPAGGEPPSTGRDARKFLVAEHVIRKRELYPLRG